MRIKTFRKFILSSLFFFILFISNQCSKTEDVVLIEDTTNPTDSTVTIYYGFVLNEVLYDPPGGITGDANVYLHHH